MASASSARPAGDDIVIPLIDDLHLHLRDGATAASLLADLPATVARALVMPNLKPPVVNAADVAAYGARLAGWLPAGSRFKPLMSLYLTDRTDAASARARVARLP
jgi:dihydroorotase